MAATKFQTHTRSTMQDVLDHGQWLLTNNPPHPRVNIGSCYLQSSLHICKCLTVDITRNVSVAIFIIEMRNIRVVERFLHSSYNKRQVRQIMRWIREETHGKPCSNFMIDFDMSTNDEHRLRINIIPSAESGLTRVFVPPLG